jgi:SAM-dependent methyltransferase
MGFLKGALFRLPNTIYRGLTNGCAPGVHEAIVDALKSHVAHKDDVLDLGAGYGALLARLEDQGFSGLHAADLGGEAFRQTGISHTRVDLDGPFAAAFDKKYKIVVSTEVIEHIESPRNFLKQTRLLMADNGYAVISTPNVGFWEGRIKFLLTGQLWGFGERHYRSLRHISPMTLDQMRMVMRELGLEIVSVSTAGSFATPLRWAMLAPIWGPMRLLLGPQTLGEAVVFVVRKCEPDATLAVPTTYREVWKAAEGHGGAAQPTAASL